MCGWITLKPAFMKNVIFIFFALLSFSFSNSATAGCGGVCIHIDPNLPMAYGYGKTECDTVLVSPGGEVTLYATYNGACEQIFIDTTIVNWYRDDVFIGSSTGVMISTWRYTATFKVTEPGNYTVAFGNAQAGPYNPDATCRSVEVITVPMLDSEPVEKAIEAIGKEGDLNVFPNPAEDKITVSTKVPSQQLITTTIIDYSGKKVKRVAEKAEGDYNTTILINDLAPGIYFYSVKTNTGTRKGKMIKL